MSIDSKHPEYDSWIESWVRSRDVYDGPARIRDKIELYLPPTTSMWKDGMQIGQVGRKNYESYAERALFHDYMAEAISFNIGVLHQNPLSVQLPASMESMIERCTPEGDGLEGFLRRMNVEQLICGRVGIMADLPTDPTLGEIPYLSLYRAETIINWHGSNLVVLDETGDVMNDSFDWTLVRRYRVLRLDGVYSVLVDQEGNRSEVVPTYRGRTLDRIPFHVANTTRAGLEVEKPPLLGLADLCLAIFRAEADYRQHLHHQGQDTLVVKGRSAQSEGDEIRLGVGSVINLNIEGDAKFISVGEEGLSAQRAALEDDKSRASQMATALRDQTSREAEAAKALEIRQGSTTATLRTVAVTAGRVLQDLLRDVAVWIGANPDEVVVEPNTDFSTSSIEPKAIVDMMTAKTMGAPLSIETIHQRMQEGGVTTFTYDEEMEKLAEEEPLLPPAPEVEEEVDDL